MRIAGTRCPYCQDTDDHEVTACPQVTAIEYHENGRIRRVEFGLRFPQPQPEEKK